MLPRYPTGDPEMNESKNGLPRPEEVRSDVAPFPAGMLRVPASPPYLALVGNVVRWFGGQAGLSDEKCGELEVAVDEACTNVIRHAFPEATHREMTILCSASDSGLRVTVQDMGTPFDLEQGAQTARDKRSLDPASGGMGLLLIRRLTDAVDYQWDEQQGNQLTLVKHK